MLFDLIEGMRIAQLLPENRLRGDDANVADCCIRAEVTSSTYAWQSLNVGNIGICCIRLQPCSSATTHLTQLLIDCLLRRHDPRVRLILHIQRRVG